MDNIKLYEIMASIVIIMIVLITYFTLRKIHKPGIRRVFIGNAKLFVADNDLAIDNKCIFVKNNSFVEWYLFSTSNKPISLITTKDLNRTDLKIIDSILLYRKGIRHVIYHPTSKVLIVVLKEGEAELCPYTTIIIS